MALSSVLKRFPDIGRQFTQFLLHPRTQAKRWTVEVESRAPSKEILGWCLATIILLLGLYELGFGSLTDNLLKATGMPLPIASASASAVTARPSVEDIGWQLGFGVGIDLPQASKIPLGNPQLVVFTFGASHVVMSGIVPDVLTKKPITTLLLSLYALLTVLCIHLPARMLGGAGKLVEATKLALNYYAFVTLFATALAVVAVILIVHTLKLEGPMVIASWVFLVLLPFIVVSIRGFFATFSEYYGLTKKKLFLAGIGSLVCSSLLGPVLLVPTLFLLFRTAPLLETVL